eukprot:2158206-Rhodomonas_salina.8
MLLPDYCPPFSETALARQVNSAISLRAAHTMSGTDVAPGRICLRACYALSSTDLLAYRGCTSYAISGMRFLVFDFTAYVLSGIDVAYAATSNRQYRVGSER